MFARAPPGYRKSMDVLIAGGHGKIARRMIRRLARDDVAFVLAETLHAPRTIGLTFEVFSGKTPVREAIGSLGR
jgi:aspartate-semialdehyde dehydrogenase